MLIVKENLLVGVGCSKEIFEILLSVVPGETGNDEIWHSLTSTRAALNWHWIRRLQSCLILTTVLKSWPAVENWLSAIETSAYLELDQIPEP